MDQFCYINRDSVCSSRLRDFTLRRGGQVDLQPHAAYRAEVVLADFVERLARLGAKALDPPQSFAASTSNSSLIVDEVHEAQSFESPPHLHVNLRSTWTFTEEWLHRSCTTSII